MRIPASARAGNSWWFQHVYWSETNACVFFRQRIQGLLRRHQVWTRLVVAVFNALQNSGDANLKELIQIAGGDGEKFDPLQQRIGVILGFFQHAPVEVHPGFVSIEVLLCHEREFRGCFSVPCVRALLPVGHRNILAGKIDSSQCLKSLRPRVPVGDDGHVNLILRTAIRYPKAGNCVLQPGCRMGWASRSNSTGAEKEAVEGKKLHSSARFVIYSLAPTTRQYCSIANRLMKEMPKTFSKARCGLSAIPLVHGTCRRGRRHSRRARRRRRPIPIKGSAAQQKATPGVLPLSLEDAIQMGLKNNLGAILQNTQCQVRRRSQAAATAGAAAHAYRHGAGRRVTGQSAGRRPANSRISGGDWALRVYRFSRHAESNPAECLLAAKLSGVRNIILRRASFRRPIRRTWWF